jgi:diacylglycerol kinase (ATP)
VTAGARAVVACGGDGTVHAVAQALVGQHVPLGVVAGGSGDDIAASLGISTGDPTATADWLERALASNRTRVIDVGRAQADGATSRYFLSVLCTGFDASVNERANRMPRLAGQRYNIAIVRELASFTPLTYRVRTDDRERTGEAMLVSIGNGPRFGGGMLICPDAVMDDGELDVLWLSAVSRPTFLRVFPTVFRGRHTRHPAVTMSRARSIRVEAPGQIAYADGERIGALPVDVTVCPGALRVLTT